MDNNLRNCIYRQYIALARNEHYTPSEIGETRLDADLLQLNYTEPADADLIREKLNLTDEQFFKKGVIQKPSKLENLIICAELRKKHGQEVLSEIEQFDQNGNLELPKSEGYLIPQRANGLIFELKVERL